MSRIFAQPSTIKLPQRHREAQHDEYGKELGGIAICPECHNMHRKKKWHHTASIVPEHLRGYEDKIRRELCPACKMAKDHTFEGELLLLFVPERCEHDMLHLIRSFGERATEQDPQDRILEVQQLSNGYRVTTTENQMAVQLAKKIQSAFKKFEVRIAHSAEPYEVTRIRAEFYEGKEMPTKRKRS